LKAHSDSARILWLSLVLSFILAYSFVLPVFPNDYWWYLRLGHDTLLAGTVPQLEYMSYSQMGTPVVNFSWGTAVLFWLIYKAGGLTLTVLVRGVILAMAYALIWLTVRRLGAGRITGALVLLLAALASLDNWSIRPQLFAYPLFTLALYLLYRWHNGDSKAVCWLPLISLVWVNLHGSFIMLILLTGAALIFGRGEKRFLGTAFAGVLLTTLLNPRGFGSWTYVFDLLTSSSIQKFTSEWGPPINNNWVTNIFFLWFLLFPLLAAFSPRKLDRLEWAWFLGFGFLALWGTRNIIWFVFILAVLTSVMLADWERKLKINQKRGFPALNLALSLIFLLLPLGLLPGVRNTWWPQARSATENTPIAAAAWLADHPDLPGPLWSEIGFSSYLEFALPEWPVWIDTRFEVFPPQQWQAYADITYARYNYLSLLDETGANLLMISVKEQPVLLQALAKQAEWCEIYRDKVAVIYQRNPGSKPGWCGDD
jgi:hypothetical protein